MQAHGNTNNKHGETHGMKYTPVYKSWEQMKQRCLNKNNPSYHNYGGRGILICQDWINDFLCFYEDMGDKPESLSLDRIDNDGNYEPTNCRWADRKTQSNNQRIRKDAVITPELCEKVRAILKSKPTMTQRAIAKEFGVGYRAINRIVNGSTRF